MQKQKLKTKQLLTFKRSNSFLKVAIKQPLVCTGGSNVGHNFMCIQVNVDIKPVSPALIVRTTDNMQIKCKWFIWWRWPWGCCLDSSAGSGLLSNKRWHQSFEYFQAPVNMAGNHPSSLKQGLSSAAARLGIRNLFNFHPKHIFVLSSTTYPQPVMADGLLKGRFSFSPSPNHLLIGSHCWGFPLFSLYYLYQSVINLDNEQYVKIVLLLKVIKIF